VESDLRILHAVARAVSRSLDAGEVRRTAVEALPRLVGHAVAALHAISPERAELRLEEERGLSARLRDVMARWPVGDGPIGGVAASGVTLVLKSVADDRAFSRAARAAMAADGIRGLLCVALHGRDGLLGTLTLGRRTDDPFTDAEVALVEAIAGIIGLALDTVRLHAELQRAHAHLVRADQLSAVGQLASGVAHEINNPLTTILGQSHLLLAQPALPQPVRDRVAIIAEETSRAARIVQNLLVFSRHDPPERRLCLLQDQVRRVLDLKTYQLQHDGIDVVTELADCDPVLGDEHQLQHVLLGLVQNAHQAMVDVDGPRVLTIRLAVEHGGPTPDGPPNVEHGGPTPGGPPNVEHGGPTPGGPPNPLGPRAVLAVLDTGPGIPADVLPRIFEPFFTTKAPGEGSGLGLSVAKGIATEHQGRLWAENRPEGGAAFFLDLPLER
jgi:signal transduction histidine kinase